MSFKQLLKNLLILANYFNIRVISINIYFLKKKLNRLAGYLSEYKLFVLTINCFVTIFETKIRAKTSHNIVL
jgi:hypothetical protein